MSYTVTLKVFGSGTIWREDKDDGSKTNYTGSDSLSGSTYTLTTHSDNTIILGKSTSGVASITWATKANAKISNTHTTSSKYETYVGKIGPGYTCELTFSGNTIVCVSLGTPKTDGTRVPIYCKRGSNCSSFRVGTSASSYTTVSTTTNTVVSYVYGTTSGSVKVFYPQASGSQTKTIMKYSSNGTISAPNTDSGEFNVKCSYANGKAINPLYYARWIEVRCKAASVTTYTITYNSNNGQSQTETQSKTSGDDVEIYNNDFSPQYIYKYFSHWNTKADGTGTSYAEGATYSTNANLTLYAIWANYTVGVNINGTWKKATPYVNVSGTWKQCKPFVNVNGTWLDVNIE